MCEAETTKNTKQGDTNLGFYIILFFAVLFIPVRTHIVFRFIH